MYKARELWVEGCSQVSLKQKIMFETMPKDILGRKVKTTPALALNFLQRCLGNKTKGKIDFYEE